MADRRGSRFVAEALFLVALAVALTLARLDTLEIAGAMLLGWLVVAALEWAAWRAEPHFGSGLPPRYHVPPVKLPPPQPLEQVDRGYPDASREEAPTWIASAALRAEVLGEWPVAIVPVADEELEPAGGLPDRDRQPAPEDEDVFADAPAPAVDPDPWTVASLPVVTDDDEPDDPVPAPSPVPVRVVGVEVTMARYTLEPLADPPPRRRLAVRAAVEAPAIVEVPARPLPPRPLPGSLGS